MITARPRPWLLAAALASAGSSCGEGYPDIPLTLAKNCNEVEVITIAERVADLPDHEVLDVAAAGVTDPHAWILLRRSLPGGDDELVVQRVGPSGVEFEQPLGLDPVVAPGLSLRPDPSSERVWVVRSEPSLFATYRVAMDDPGRELLLSQNLTSFPDESGLCDPCETDAWHRDLVFLAQGPAIVSLPPFSVDAGLIVWLAQLNTQGSEVRLGVGHRLNFEPPCDDDESPEGQASCEMDRMTLTYPEITVLGIQEDPRQSQTAIFGHRSRRRVYDGKDVPIDTADVFMVSVFLDSSNGTPAGVLRSYSGLYSGPIGAPPGEFSPEPSPFPPFGVAIDRFAAFGLFSNGGTLPRLVQLPNDDPDFQEMTPRVDLTLDTQLLQLDRDIAFGHLDDAGRWLITKFFPDDPPRSQELLYESDAPITEVESGGLGTFLLRKDDSAPQLVRMQCPDREPDR